jgi:hypothetical protein
MMSSLRKRHAMLVAAAERDLPWCHDLHGRTAGRIARAGALLARRFDGGWFDGAHR